jgi:dihydropyrimidinase
MRTAADNEALWRGVSDGTVQSMGTDHCPFFFDGSRPIVYEGQPMAIPGKELGRQDFTKIPNGLPGVEDRLPVLWTYGVRAGRITANQYVALNSTNPARIFGLYPKKGALQPGSDADIVIWDPERRIHYDYSLYEGWELVGFPEKVMLRGKLIVDGEKWLGGRGQGQFVARHAGEVL